MPDNEAHTFTAQYTGVQYIDAEGNKTQLSLVSGEPLKVTREGDIWIISLSFRRYGRIPKRHRL